MPLKFSVLNLYKKDRNRSQDNVKLIVCEKQAFFWLNYGTILHTGRDGLLSFCSLKTTTGTVCSVTIAFTLK